MYLFETILAVAILLCALVSGMILVFSIVVMPGIATLENREYLKAFQVIDGVIQNNQPVFLFVWLGSALAMILLAGIALLYLSGVSLILSLSATGLYICGVQVPTVLVNIPLNNRLQALDLEEMSDDELEEFREVFEGRWTRWNNIRTVLAIISVVMLLGVIFVR